MTGHTPPPPPPRDILLFAPQGARPGSHKPRASQQDPDLQGQVDRFLDDCLDAFHSECTSLTDTERRRFLPHSVSSHITTARDLVAPPPEAHANPVVESVTFFVNQIVDLLHYLGANAHHERLLATEICGLCSGLLPAVVASSSAAPVVVPDLLGLALATFRLAFWIGLRAHSTVTEEGVDGRVLTVYGETADGLREKIERYNKGVVLDQGRVRISAIFAHTVVALSGDMVALEGFKQNLASSTAARYSHVHGHYHGGPDMASAVQTILEDVKRRCIPFPDWNALQVPVVLATSGSVLEQPETSQTATLLEAILQHMLVDTLDWHQTWQYLDTTSLSAASELSPIRLVLLGPNTASLRLAWQGLPKRPHVETTDSQSILRLSRQKDDIAIVGMSFDFPRAKDSKEFWDLLQNGVSAVQEIPASRFDNAPYLAAARSAGSTNTKQGQQQQQQTQSTRSMAINHGNFLDDPFRFDNEFFRLSPREAQTMDPQQRLLLHASLDALEDAGYAPDSTPTFQTKNFGVYVGVATGDYVENLRDRIDVYYSPGTLRAFLSGRLSYAFGFEGPSMVVDTACSSSLVAIAQACSALQAGQCDAALAGGVNVITAPDMYLGLARAHFLSPSGQCKPFDEGADGYCRGEGCGVVVLKRLSQALAEGDVIHGVIRGVAVNQCGRAKSITHPDAREQGRLFRDLLAKADVDPRTISVVEAHGTGTQAGDAAEVTSLRSVFGGQDHTAQRRDRLIVSSVKGNIGHAEAASGMAGLVKLLLMMKHGHIPPQASLTRLSTRLNLDDDSSVLFVPRRLTPWKVDKNSSRRAILNNFGAAGSNAALLLEEGPRIQRVRRELALRADPSSYILNISARTKPALERLQTAYADLLDRVSSGIVEEVRVADLCYSATARRTEYPDFRLSVVGKSAEDLQSQLLRAEITSSPGSSSSPSNHKTVFVFSGQGSIHDGMGAELLETEPTFASAIRVCDAILSSAGFPPISGYISGSAGGKQAGSSPQIVVEQCACFALEYALGKMLVHWGLTPDIMIGHSLGEYAAFAVSGALSLKEALLLVARRADLMARNCTQDVSGMMACRMSSDAVESIIHEDPDRLGGIEIACENAPGDTVVAGTSDALDAFQDVCRSRGLRTTKLDVPFAFHSAAMDPILEEFEREARKVIRFCAPSSKILVGSSLRGEFLPPGQVIDSSYFVEHVRKPVKFCDIVADIPRMLGTVSARDRVKVLEIGPSASTIPKMKWAFSDTESVSFLPTLQGTKQLPWSSLCDTLRTLYLDGYPIKWRNVYAGSDPRFVDCLPRYPLGGKSFVIPFREPQGHTPASGPGDHLAQSSSSPYRFLGPRCTPEDRNNGQGEEGTVEFLLDAEPTTPFIMAHRVGDVPLCPASVYIELAMEAAACDGPEGAKGGQPGPGPSYMLSDVEFHHPLVLSEPDHALPRVSLQLRASQEDASTPSSSSYLWEALISQPGQRRALCSGTLEKVVATTTPISQKVARKTALVQRQMMQSTFRNPALATLPGGGGGGGGMIETFTSRTVYDVIFPRVVSYSAPLRTIESLSISHCGLEAHGTFRMPAEESNDRRPFVFHPALSDTMLHAAGFVANTKVDSDMVCICSRIDSVFCADLPPGSGSETKTPPLLRVYCSLVDLGASFVADAYVCDEQYRVLCWTEGIEFRKLALKAFKARLPRLASSGVGQAVNNYKQRPPQEQEARRRRLSGPGSGTSTTRVVPRQAPAPRLRQVSTADSDTTLTDILSTMRELCGDDGAGGSWRPQTTLAELGIDSLLRLELTDALIKRFPRLVAGGPPLDIESCQTVQDVQDLVVTALGTAPGFSSRDTTRPREPSTTTLKVPLRPDTTRMIDEARVSTQPPPPRNSIEIRDVVRDLFDIHVDDDAMQNVPLRALGIDSLGSIELFDRLRKMSGNPSLIADHSADSGGGDDDDLTLRQLQGLIDTHTHTTTNSSTDTSPASTTPSRFARRAPDSPALSSPTTTTTTSPTESVGSSSEHFERLLPGAVGVPPDFPTAIGRHRSEHVPVYLFHDGSGKIFSYTQLEEVPGCNVYGIACLDFESPARDVRSMEQLAALYIDAAKLREKGDIILGGWSFGGVLAYEVARQLSRHKSSSSSRGTPAPNVLGVILIDSPPPDAHEPLPRAVIDSIVPVRDTWSSTATAKKQQHLRACLVAQFERNAGLLRDYAPGTDGSGAVDGVVVVHIVCARSFDTVRAAGVAYPWLSDAGYRRECLCVWDRIVGRRVPTLEVEQDHFNLFKPENVHEVSAALRQACNKLLGQL